MHSYYKIVAYAAMLALSSQSALAQTYNDLVVNQVQYTNVPQILVSGGRDYFAPQAPIVPSGGYVPNSNTSYLDCSKPGVTPAGCPSSSSYTGTSNPNACTPIGATTATFTPGKTSSNCNILLGSGASASVNVLTAAECQSKCQDVRANQISATPNLCSADRNVSTCTFVDATPKLTGCASTYSPAASPASMQCVTNYTMSDGSTAQSSVTAASAADCHAKSGNWTNTASGITYTGQNCSLKDNTPKMTSCTLLFSQDTQTCNGSIVLDNGVQIVDAHANVSSLAQCQSVSTSPVSSQYGSYTPTNCTVKATTPPSTTFSAFSIRINTATQICTGSFKKGTVTYNVNVPGMTSASACVAKLQADYPGMPSFAIQDVTPAYTMKDCTFDYDAKNNTCDISYTVGRIDSENITVTLNRALNITTRANCKNMGETLNSPTYGYLTGTCRAH
jgi:hypothetical protein